jgi:hypothetical protein
VALDLTKDPGRDKLTQMNGCLNGAGRSPLQVHGLGPTKARTQIAIQGTKGEASEGANLNPARKGLRKSAPH